MGGAGLSFRRCRTVWIVVAVTIAAGLSSLIAKPVGAAKAVAISNGQFQTMLIAGQRDSSRGNVQFGEILGISSPGGGVILRIHSAFNIARGIESSAIDEVSGLLRADAKAVESISVQSVVIGDVGYIRPTTKGAKWTKEILTPSAAKSPVLVSNLLALTGARTVSRIATSRSTATYRITLRASDLGFLRSFASQVPAKALASLTAHETALLAGVVLSFPKFEITLDNRNRLIQLKLGGILTETRADAAARHSRYPKGGIEGVVLLDLKYAYGGVLKVSPPPLSQVLNNAKPLR